ncbi:AP-5 complex subunit beta-1 [Nephila pilipes]|uniref:AP-5 complex subunit beta-1 n=1 Tax=Nephila pilipes TaxID=299642 RepID=A0A8X6PP97_NEPPI|nr:AP-5 complex subunit beta-1 [Nephila pilipes]
MVVKLNKSLLGEDWLQSFCIFRLHPKIFLDKRKLTRDAFCLDVLKDLYLDHVETQCKIHLLLLLQEHSCFLITEYNLLEQVVESLINLCNVLGTKSDKRLLKNQSLVAIMTIILSQNLDTSILIIRVKSFLLKIINDCSEDSTVLSTACKCLEELEEFFPGSLESEITNISATCEREMSPAFQSYALLLSVCIKHFNPKVSSKTRVLQEKTDIEVKKGEAEIAPFASHLFELLPFMTHIAAYRVLKELMHIVSHTPQLSPKTFKLYLQSLIMSSDVSQFHLAFELLDVFGSSLFSEQEEKFLFKQLIKLSTNPCLTPSHRLLLLDWLRNCIMHSKSNYISSQSHYFDLPILLPTPFDGPLTQEKKSYVLALCIPSHTKENLSAEFLNETVNGLIKCSLLPGGTKAAPSLFRILFVYFSSYKSEIMHNFMYRLLSGIMKTSPHLMPYALSFLQAVRNECQSNFHERILSHLVEHILSIPMKQFISNLECYLAVLESASQECASVCRPRGVLKLLQKLLNNVDLKLRNAWSVGNDILSVCRSFLKYHDVQIFYYDLAEVLCLVSQNVNDTDVKDRAKIYYSMLTSLSKIKVQAIFQLHESEKDATSALSSFVTGNDVGQFVSSIQKLSKSVLQLLRCEQNDTLMKEISAEALDFHDVLETYNQYLENYEPIVKLPFILKHVEDVDEVFTHLFSIVITVHSFPVTKEIAAIEIPVLRKYVPSENKEKVIYLSIVPLEPYPLTLHFEAEFTCKNGCSYTCDLPSVDIKFEDLFMPLPIPVSLQKFANSWRQKLFEILWEEFLQVKSSKTVSNHCQSSFCLKIEKENFATFIEQKWKAFIVSKLNDFAYNVAMYIPPENHLLMKISVVNNKVFVNINVDNSNILPWVTLCLQSL